jgi:hypothetical protein
LKRRPALKGSKKRGQESGQYVPEGESKGKGQLPVYQSNRSLREQAMEIQEMPVVDVPESDPVPSLEDQELDRIASELWQRGSLAELAEANQAELEEVACRASCL